MPAALLAFGAGAPHAGRPRILEDHRGNLLAEPKHLVGHLPDLPLGAVAAPQREEVEELPGVHGDGDVGSAGVRQEVPGVLVGDPKLLQLRVGLPYGAHDAVEDLLRLGVALDGGRGHERCGFHGDIPLALLGVGCHPVPHELVGERPGHPFDAESEHGVLDDGMVPHPDDPGQRLLRVDALYDLG